MRRAVLDANLLVLLVVGFVDKNLIAKHKRTEQFALEDFDTLTAHLAQYGAIHVTPHTLGEASNLLSQNRAKKHLLEGLRVIIGTLVEVYIPSEDAARNSCYPQNGLTDATIAEAVAAGAELVTVDFQLYHQLASRGFLAINFNHLRTGAWK